MLQRTGVVDSSAHPIHGGVFVSLCRNEDKNSQA